MPHHGNGEKAPHKWAPYQIAGAFLMLFVSLGMFVIQGLAPIWFGKPVDFGILPYSLLVISAYVIWGLNLPEMFGKDK